MVSCNSVMMSVWDLTPYQKNPRKNQEAIDHVAKSLAQFGFRQPIVVDRDLIVIVGHTRLEAAKILGITEVPVHVADDMSEEDARAYRILDNKSAEYATWDTELLGCELGELALGGIYTHDFFGFDSLDPAPDPEARDEETQATIIIKIDPSELDECMTQIEKLGLEPASINVKIGKKKPRKNRGIKRD